MSEINQSRFAKLSGVSRPAIIKAIKTGKLILTASKKIDDKDPLSIAYMRKQLDKSRTSLDKKTKEVKQSKQKPDSVEKVPFNIKRFVSPDRKYRGKLRQAVFERDGHKCVNCGGSAKEGKTIEVDHIKSWSEGGKTSYDNGQTLCSDCNKGKFFLEDEANKENQSENSEDRLNQLMDKDDVDIEYKKVQTEKIKIANANTLNLLVPMDFVKVKFGKMAAVILNHFFPLGGRLSPILCTICKITDPKIKKEIELAVNKEITRGLAEFKKVAIEEIKE